MNICVIANGYPNEHEPQYGCFERDQALALLNNEHRVSILYVDGRLNSPNKRKRGIFHAEYKGIQVFGIYVLPISGIRLINKRLHYWVVTRLLEKAYIQMLKKSGKPDIIYAHFMYNIAYAVYLKKKYGISLVGIEHWSVLNRSKLSKEQMFWGNIAYNGADRILAVSESLQIKIREHFKRNSIVVYNMLGEEFVKHTSTKYLKKESDAIYQDALKDGHFFFLGVGSLIQRKGFDILIEAFAKSHLMEKGCRVVIVGGGPEHDILKKLSITMGVAEGVSLVGRQNKAEIINIMRASDVFVLSSRAETFGVVCIEALSQGLPNIATICGGPEEFLTEEDGILIPTGNVDALANAMLQMYNNYSHYNKKSIIEHCTKRFAPQVIVSQLTNIFMEVLEQNRVNNN